MLEKPHFTICFPHQPPLHIVCQVFKLFSHPSFTTSHQINLQVSGQMEHMSTPDWRSEPRPGAQKEKPSAALEAGALQRQKNGQFITTNGFSSKSKRQKKTHFLLSSEILLEQQKRNPRQCMYPSFQPGSSLHQTFISNPYSQALLWPELSDHSFPRSLWRCSSQTATFEGKEKAILITLNFAKENEHMPNK